jgi:hypothetical protein
MLSDEFMPIYDVSDGVATVVGANVGSTWQTLLDVDLIEVGRKRPLVGVLGAIRILPEVLNQLLHGSVPSSRPGRLRLRDLEQVPLDQGGWVLLGQRDGDEIALGLVGKFWKPVIEFGAVRSPQEFRDFAQPGFAKTVYSLSVRPLAGGRTLLSAVMRTTTTDVAARRWFRRYWTFGVGPGAHVLANGLLEITRELAEQKGRQRAA